MSAHLEQAVCWNNEGASLLRVGRLDAAACVLWKAIDTLLTSSLECNGQMSFLSEIAGLRSFSSETTKVTDFHSDLYNQDGMSYIFDRPMLLKTKGILIKSQANHFRTLHTIGVYVVFNLALVHHIRGKLSGADKPYIQASRLYHITLMEAIRMARRGVILQCLVMNNLSDLYGVFCEYQCSKHCIDCVAAINSRTKCLDNSKALSDREVNGIILNHFVAQFTMAAQSA